MSQWFRMRTLFPSSDFDELFYLVYDYKVHNVFHEINSIFLKIFKHNWGHSGEKPFQCSFCQKTYIQSSNSTTHKCNHSGKKPFQCSLCLKLFKTSHKCNAFKGSLNGEKNSNDSSVKRHFLNIVIYTYINSCLVE